MPIIPCEIGGVLNSELSLWVRHLLFPYFVAYPSMFPPILGYFFNIETNNKQTIFVKNS